MNNVFLKHTENNRCNKKTVKKALPNFIPLKNVVKLKA